MITGAPEYNYEQFQEILRTLPFSCSFPDKNTKDVQKLCRAYLKVLEGNLSLEQVTSLYSVSISLFLLGPNRGRHCSRRLELLNECFNYSDTLKPTMIDYAVRNLLATFRIISNSDQTSTDYILHLLEAIPHILVSSETGKIISMGLLRAFIADLSGLKPPIVMHVYRNLSEIWQMVKLLNLEVVMDEWSLEKMYLLTRSFGLLMNTAAFGSNASLKLAGYRGFELPPNVPEIVEWFKTLKNKLETKHKQSKECKRVVQNIDYNILSLLSELKNEAVAL